MRHLQLLCAAALGSIVGLAADDPPEPTHVEIEPIRIELGRKGEIETMAMDSRGNLLLGVHWKVDGDKEGRAIKTVSPAGKVLRTLPLRSGVAPTMIHGCDNGEMYVAGNGYIVRYNADGRRLGQVDTDKVYGEGRPHASGLYVTDTHVWIAFGLGRSLRATEDIFRFNRDLTAPKKMVETVYGCCGHIDLEVRDGELLVAENSRHRVKRFDLDGKLLGTWGKRDRTGIEGFAACCNPCNTDFAPGGALYTAESGVGRVKKYRQDGTFVGLVGYVDTTKFDRGSRLAASSCYIPVEVSADERRVYVLDVRAEFIRVLERKPE